MRSLRIPISSLIAAGALVVTLGEARAQGPAPVLDRECVRDCRHAYVRCTQAAHASARLCLLSCEPLIAKAKEVCAAAPESEECMAARREAAACVRPCRVALSADLRRCLAEAKDCVALCPDTEPPVPAEPLCLGQCRRLVQACLERAHAAARECAAACDDLVGKARQVCAEDPRSEECAEARRDATACLQPCREQLAASTRQCVANGQSCAASCRPAPGLTSRPTIR